MNIDKVFSCKTCNETHWKNLILSGSVKSHFLVIVIPLLDYVCQKTSRDKSQTKKEIEPILHRYIYQSFIQDVLIMIERVCVFEMRSASQSQLLKGNTSQKRFQYFIHLLCQSSIRIDLLKKYPVLKKSLIVYAYQKIHEIKELIIRLDHDKKILVTHFLKNDPLFYLSNIIASGDKHQGKSVLILTFKKEKKTIKIIYKPRSVAIAVAFQNLITWVNTHSTKTKLYRLNIISRKDYGWIEFIPHQVCNTIHEIKDFYYRQGMLLMLSYLMNGYDLHYENLIAFGTYPVIVDYECFCGPVFTLSHYTRKNLHRHFVFDTQFLPGTTSSVTDENINDFSAIGGNKRVIADTMKWSNIGKDTMFVERHKKIILHNVSSKPILRHQKIDYLKYQDNFIAGFTDTYYLILKHKGNLLRKNSVLHQFRNVSSRVVFRDTQVYAEMLNENWHPKLLYNKVNNINYFKQLKKIIEIIPGYQRLVRSEIHDLIRNDIPYFYCSTTSKIIRDSTGKAIDIPVLQTGHKYIHTFLKNHITIEDLERQLLLIKNSFHAEMLNSKKINKSPENIKSSIKKPLLFNSIKPKTLSIAKREFDKLLQYHLLYDGKICWPMIDFDKNRWRSTFTNLYLYDGIAGIGLSFAYGAKIFRNKDYLKIVQLCLSTLRIKLSEFGIKNFTALGAFEGLGGILYFYGKLYLLWHNEDLKKEILSLILHSTQLLKNSQEVDLISGSAGLLLVLISLRHCIAIDDLLPFMRRCVKHMLKNKGNLKKPDDSHFSFSSKVPYLSTAHGITGIVYALQKYYILETKTSIKKNISIELANLKTKLNNSNKYLSNLMPSKKSTWCHGISGIILSKIGMLEDNSNTEYLLNLPTELSALLKIPDKYSCLCHGYLATIEVLLKSRYFIDSKKLRAEIQHYITTVIIDLKKNINNFDISNTFSPSLMTGSAGVALEMLRLIDDSVPSVLLLE